MIFELFLNNGAVVLELGLELFDKGGGLLVVIVEIYDNFLCVVVLPDELYQLKYYFLEGLYVLEGNDSDLYGLVLCVLIVSKCDDVCHFVLVSMHLQDIAKIKAKD